MRYPWEFLQEPACLKVTLDEVLVLHERGIITTEEARAALGLWPRPNRTVEEVKHAIANCTSGILRNVVCGDGKEGE